MPGVISCCLWVRVLRLSCLTRRCLNTSKSRKANVKVGDVIAKHLPVLPFINKDTCGKFEYNVESRTVRGVRGAVRLVDVTCTDIDSVVDITIRLTDHGCRTPRGCREEVRFTEVTKSIEEPESVATSKDDSISKSAHMSEYRLCRGKLPVLYKETDHVKCSS